jgi:hypothetical protein
LSDSRNWRDGVGACEMNLELQRGQKTELSTPGLLSVDGVFQCYTLEPFNPMPSGSYRIVIYNSPKFMKPVPLLLNVPGHSFIEIHWGNYPADTEDCVLVGQTRSTDFVGESLEAFAALFPKILSAIEAEAVVEITIKDPFMVSDPDMGIT